MEKGNKKEPIYEKLVPGEILIGYIPYKREHIFALIIKNPNL